MSIKIGQVQQPNQNVVTNDNGQLTTSSVISATTIYSGSTDLSDILSSINGGSGDVTRVQGGTNISTGGTANEPTINLDDSISLSSIDASNILSGGTNLNDY